MTDKDLEEKIPALIEKALGMRAFSYTPYSEYKVGAALLLQSGEIIGGCNIENIAFGPSCCAERTAIFKAISEGKKDFAAIAVAGGPAGKEVDDYCAPCGVCRQVLTEFCDRDFKVILAKSPTDYKIYRLGDILPLSFKPDAQVGRTAN